MLTYEHCALVHALEDHAVDLGFFDHYQPSRCTVWQPGNKNPLIEDVLGAVGEMYGAEGE